MPDRFQFPSRMQYQPVARLSGGERRRLYLLRLLMGAPNLLLLDEITNDLDIPTLVALEEFLETFPGCLVVVSPDRYFLDRTVDSIFRFEGDGLIREYPGNYSAFLETRERETLEQAEAEARIKAEQAQAGIKTATSAPASSKRKLSCKEQRELEELETRIAASKMRKAEIEAALSASATDQVLVQQLYEEMQTLGRESGS